MIQSHHEQAILLDNGWQFARCHSGVDTLNDPNSVEWLAAIVPGTVAQNLEKEGLWDRSEPIDLDSAEYWFRCELPILPGPGTLVFDGLATLADVWLDGVHILRSENMFVPHSVTVSALPEEDDHTLCIRFSSLTEALQTTKPRAKWRTRLAAHRNLRFIRTTLLGRMPGICPPIAPIGPWRAVRFIPATQPLLKEVKIESGIKDSRGVLQMAFGVAPMSQALTSARVKIGDTLHNLHTVLTEGNYLLSGSVQLPDVKLWWPHTHGDPFRYPITLVLSTEVSEHLINLPAIGFRTIELTGGIEDFELAVNGLHVHCRGGCWMPTDLVSLQATREEIRDLLEQCRDAGMNMIRLSGITTYESDDFYDLCDELGIMIWQDFMFASLDYPSSDATFLHAVEQEARHFLARIGYRPCLAALCGGSEIRQQVSMLGLKQAIADNSWFDEVLPRICDQFRPDVTYCPHSPYGGTLPFYAESGVSHYFAVGGYRQPVKDTQWDPPRFATECLAFSIPPDGLENNIEFLNGSGNVDWDTYVSSIPADNGSEWHFGEVTDHYLSEHFSTDAHTLRETNPHLYLDAARITVAEVMYKSLVLWRRNGFTNGALVWTLRDLLPGAGWGVFDCNGNPKAPYYFLKRAWRPSAIYFVDRGTNGLRIGLHNDGERPLSGLMELKLSSFDGRIVQESSMTLHCDASSRMEWSVDALLGGFVDSTFVYQFGARAFDLVSARFNCDDSKVILSGSYVPGNRTDDLTTPKLIGISCHAERISEKEIEVSLSTDTFVEYVFLDCKGFRMDDNYFSLLPSEPKRVKLTGKVDAQLIGMLSAFNSEPKIPIRLKNSN